MNERNDQATGAFEVKMAFETLSETAKDATFGRMSLDKKYHGDLEATSQGEMLGFRSSEQGSGGYVAMETVTGSLKGLEGSFVLQHSSTMTRGAADQSVVVVPGSGTGQLVSLSGTMEIVVADGSHSYVLVFSLQEGQISVLKAES